MSFSKDTHLSRFLAFLFFLCFNLCEIDRNKHHNIMNYHIVTFFEYIAKKMNPVYTKPVISVHFQGRGQVYRATPWVLIIPQGLLPQCGGILSEESEKIKTRWQNITGLLFWMEYLHMDIVFFFWRVSYFFWLTFVGSGFMSIDQLSK